MWQTLTRKPFVLQDKDAKFYISLVQHIILGVETKYGNEMDDWGSKTGCLIFDTATVKQKIFLLYYCLAHLTDESLEAPEPNHILEAASYFPFACMSDNWILYEIIEQEEMKRRNFIDQYYDFMEWRIKFYEIYKVNILSHKIAVEVFSNSESSFDTFEDCLNYYKKLFEFNPESTDGNKWQDVISQVAHNLVLGDGQNFRMTSLNPRLIDGIIDVEDTFGVPTDYLTSQLPKVSDQEYTEALESIKNY